MLEEGQDFAGRYRVQGRIAQGGMGVIYAAEHLSTEERVALKVLWPHVLGSKTAVDNFQLEARIAARLSSEHIVRVLDAGFDEKAGVPYLVMELLQGRTLDALVTEAGALAPRVAVEAMRQVAKALDRAHGYVDREGRPSPIVHRDLKPENLFLASREGGEPIVKVLDFGIAKVLSQSHNLTKEVRGTPLFMASEQIGGGPVTPRLDIWALGLITYYLLTGRHYWRVANEEGASMLMLVNEVLALPLESATARARATGAAPPWPPAFDAWFAGCVNRDVGARFASAGVAVEALAALFGAAPAASAGAPSVGWPGVAAAPGPSRGGAPSWPAGEPALARSGQPPSSGASPLGGAGPPGAFAPPGRSSEPWAGPRPSALPPTQAMYAPADASGAVPVAAGALRAGETGGAVAHWQTVPSAPKPARSGTPLLAGLVVVGAGVGGALVWLTVAASQARGTALEAREQAKRSAASAAIVSPSAPAEAAAVASAAPSGRASGALPAASVVVDVASPSASASASAKPKTRPGPPPKPTKPEPGPIKESLYEDR